MICQFIIKNLCKGFDTAMTSSKAKTNKTINTFLAYWVTVVLSVKIKKLC